MFSRLQQRVAAALCVLSLAMGLAAGPVHTHEHTHVGDDGQIVAHNHAHGHGHHAGHHHATDDSLQFHTAGCEHEHTPGSPCNHDEDDCTICHFLGQAAAVLVVQLDTAEAPCFDRVPKSSPQCESALPLRLTLSRGPPKREV